nr:hypothetical protein [Tanacetum cinerariifolium]
LHLRIHQKHWTDPGDGGSVGRTSCSPGTDLNFKSEDFPLPEQLPTANEDKFPLLVQSDATADELCAAAEDWSFMENEEEDHALVADEEAPTEFALMAKTNAKSEMSLKRFFTQTDRLSISLRRPRQPSRESKIGQEHGGVRIQPSPTKESNSDDLQNKNPSITETGASSSTILSKLAINFVKAAERPTESKTDKVEMAKKHAIKYAELYRKTSKRSNVRHKFWKRTGKKIKIQGSDVAGFDKSKVESDLDTMSLDDLYNHLKVYKSEVQKKSKSNSQNMAFISSAKNSSWKEDVNTASIPTTSKNVSPASVNIGAMDIKWNMALLSMRADRFWKKIGKKISIQGTDVAGFDKSKVECFNCHKMGHFARECRAPRSQDRGRKDHYKQGSKVEEQAPKALMEIDGVGWDWSFMANEEEDHALVADEEAPTEFALMAKTNAESEGNSQNHINDKGYWDSGCSRHMTGNISYLTDHEPYDGGYVSFGQGGCKITGKRTIKTGKQHKASCKTKLVNSVTKPLHTLHMDLFGPTSETSGILRNFITEIENLKELRVKIARCDNEGAFRNKEMNDFCSKKGIEREFSNAKTPQQNGTCTATGSANEGTATKKGRIVALTTKDMQKRKNDVKARTTLLFGLPDEHQLRFISISQDTACAYIASQSSVSQIKFEDITQIDEDDIEEMDIKWNMALLSMRADRF